jgi:hypothetical protein
MTGQSLQCRLEHASVLLAYARDTAAVIRKLTDIVARSVAARVREIANG